MTAKRVLITGGTGFIGANLARHALALGYETHLLVRRQHRPWRIQEIMHRLHLHTLDITDYGSVQRCLRDVKPAWVLHLAAYGAYPGQQDLPSAISTNVQATAAMLMASRSVGVEAFVHAGSSSEYGFKDRPSRESDRLDPNSYYAATKAAATLLCCEMRQQEHLPVVTLRLFSVFGPFEEPTRLIPTLITHAVDGTLPQLADAKTARDFIYVDDVCAAFVLAAENAAQGSPVYNVGSGRALTLRDVVKTAREVLDVSAEPVWGSMPSRTWDTDRWCGDVTLIATELGWKPTTPFDVGLRHTSKWILSSPAMRAVYRGTGSANRSTADETR